MFNKVVDAVMPVATTSNIDEASSRDASTERLFFLDAPGATEKKIVTSAVQRFLNSKEKNIETVASSAAAAQLLHDGITVHSALQIPGLAEQYRTCNVSADSPLADTAQNVDLLKWEEIAKSHLSNLKAVEITFRDVTQSILPFGGSAVLVVRDFRQILPVVWAASRSQIACASFKRSHPYSVFKLLHLRENM